MLQQEIDVDWRENVKNINFGAEGRRQKILLSFRDVYLFFAFRRFIVIENKILFTLFKKRPVVTIVPLHRKSSVCKIFVYLLWNRKFKVILDIFRKLSSSTGCNSTQRNNSNNAFLNPRHYCYTLFILKTNIFIVCLYYLINWNCFISNLIIY